jgi:hypothetical protein
MIVQPSPAAGRGWHVLQTITTLVVTFVLPPAAHASPHPRGSQTGSDALVGILVVVVEEEPSSKHGHGDACSSAGGVRTATLARAPRRLLHERPRASREGPPCGRLVGVWDRSNEYCTEVYRPRTCLGRSAEVHASVTKTMCRFCAGFTSLLKRTRIHSFVVKRRASYHPGVQHPAHRPARLSSWLSSKLYSV